METKVQDAVCQSKWFSFNDTQSNHVILLTAMQCLKNKLLDQMIHSLGTRLCL